MSLLPTIDKNLSFSDGTYIKALNFCKSNNNKGKCLEFYKSIYSNPRKGFVTCPFGMSMYMDLEDDGALIYTAFREKDTYMKKKAKRINNNGDGIAYNPILQAEQLFQLMDASDKGNDLEKKQNVIDNISHDVKKLNSQIKEHCELLFSTYNLDNENTVLNESDIQRILSEIKTIYLSSCMIFSRYSLYDYEKNAEFLTKGTQFNCNVYKKFDKMRKIFKNYMNKSISILLEGKSYKHIKAYSSFEMIPLLLIDNAVKYSINNDVIIRFQENNSLLKVTIESFSPYCYPSEVAHIFNKGYRGIEATKSSDGSGIGLYFVKLLCDLHHVNISVFSDSKKITVINKVKYAPFIVSLDIQNVFDVL